MVIAFGALPVIGVTPLASCISAWRAARVDPMEAFRRDQNGERRPTASRPDSNSLVRSPLLLVLSPIGQELTPNQYTVERCNRISTEKRNRILLLCKTLSHHSAYISFRRFTRQRIDHKSGDRCGYEVIDDLYQSDSRVARSVRSPDFRYQLQSESRAGNKSAKIARQRCKWRLEQIDALSQRPASYDQQVGELANRHTEVER